MIISNNFTKMKRNSVYLIICSVLVNSLVQAQQGQRIDLSDLQGTWQVEEYFPKSGGMSQTESNGRRDASHNQSSTNQNLLPPTALACDSNLDVTFEITGNIWRRQSSNPDRFNSNGKYYILQAVQGNEMNYVKFRVFQDLVTEINPCIGYVREGKILRIQMNATDFTNCPNQPDEYAGVCNKWIFTTAKCTGGRCLTGGGTQTKSRFGSGSDDAGDTKTSHGHLTATFITFIHFFVLFAVYKISI